LELGIPAFVLHIGATVLLNGRSRYGSRNCNYGRTRGNSRRGVGWRSRHGSLRGSCEAQDFVGNIYKGKWRKCCLACSAAFVDIGLAKAAFMHVSDLSLDSEPGDTLVDVDEDDKDTDKDGDMLGPRRQSSKPIEQLLSEGQELMVQISKGPIARKARGSRPMCRSLAGISFSCPTWNISVCPAASPVTRSGLDSRTL